MASNFGFVYLIGNPFMPDVYKIGFSDRSPNQRALELSAGTGCPHPFHVICYIEVSDPMAHERDMHDLFSRYRISPNREFFHVGREDIALLLSAFQFHPEKLMIAKDASFYGALEGSKGWSPDIDPDSLLINVYREYAEGRF